MLVLNNMRMWDRDATYVFALLLINFVDVVVKHCCCVAKHCYELHMIGI